MKTETDRGKYVGLLFIIVLFLSLAVCALFSVLIGAGVYENINDRMEGNYQSQTAMSYISNKIKQADLCDSVFVADNKGTSVLVLRENLDGTEYQTLIYYYEGNIMELYSEKDADLTLSDGLAVIEANALEFKQLSDSMIKVSLDTPEGVPETMFISVRSNMNSIGDKTLDLPLSWEEVALND